MRTQICSTTFAQCWRERQGDVGLKRLEVSVLPMCHGVSFYQVGTVSFDEEDRNLSYIDEQINTWLTWRRWVEENGEVKP